MVKHTSALWAVHPGIELTISSHTSTDILGRLDNLQLDAGITYLDNEPLGRVYEVPLYREHYHLVTAADGPFRDRKSVTWEEAATLPLCLLSRDMQNRRIIDQVFRKRDRDPPEAGIELDRRSISTHLNSGVWSTIMPHIMVQPWICRLRYGDSAGRAGNTIASRSLAQRDRSHR